MKIVIVLQCTKYSGKQTQYREVTGIYKFMLPEDVRRCCLQICNVYLMMLTMGYKFYHSMFFHN